MAHKGKACNRAPRRCALALLAALLPGLWLAGCTSRGMTITSVPEGADVTVNRRPVGKTPVRVNYTHYGTYRVELRKERYQTLVRKEKLHPPLYGYDPLTFFADNVVPARLNDEVYLHYALKPIPEDFNRDSLMKRADLARQGRVIHPLTKQEYRVVFARKPRYKIATDLSAQAEGPSPLPELDLPAKAEPPAVAKPLPPASGGKVITERRPEGPRIAKELGLEKKGEKKKKSARTVPAKRKRRTPKGEILIYDEQPIEDPEKKKKK